ncbi:MAG: hypothetical protein IKH58_11565 [Bacteroidales bacterium]|nr:hypothetical protein [Bacteroidales bacterium]
MRNLFRLYWRTERLSFVLTILFFLVFSAFMLAITWRKHPETDVWGFINGTWNDQESHYSTTEMFNWIFLFPWFMCITHCLSVFGVYRLHKQHWLLPVTMKEKYASRIVFNICQTIVLVLASALIIYWVRIPLAYFFSIEQPIERGWLLPLLAWYYRWPTVVFYLWILTICYYLSARFMKNTFVAFVPMALAAAYPFCALFLDTFWNWFPYVAVVLVVGIAINIYLGYRQFQKLDVVLKLTPKAL